MSDKIHPNPLPQPHVTQAAATPLGKSSPKRGVNGEPGPGNGSGHALYAVYDDQGLVGRVYRRGDPTPTR